MAGRQGFEAKGPEDVWVRLWCECVDFGIDFSAPCQQSAKPTFNWSVSIVLTKNQKK